MASERSKDFHRFPKVGTCQNHCPIVAIVCSLESSAFLSLSAFIFWGSDQHRRAFAALSLSLSLLFGSIYLVCIHGEMRPRQNSATKWLMGSQCLSGLHVDKASQRVTSPIFCSVFVNSLDISGHANALANKITSCPPKNNSSKKTII